jgi:hypothetical protein
MDKLSDIAKDYLADFEVLTDARKEFEEQMDDWWSGVFHKHVKPELTALTKETQSALHIWENQDNPGMCHCRAVENQQVFLEITDPRTSKRKFYTVALFVKSQPALKKLRQKEEAVKRLSHLAATPEVGVQAGLKWNNTELAREDIEILPDEPEKTAEKVSAAAVRFFRLVIEHHRATSETPISEIP